MKLHLCQTRLPNASTIQSSYTGSKDRPCVLHPKAQGWRSKETSDVECSLIGMFQSHLAWIKWLMRVDIILRQRELAGTVPAFPNLGNSSELGSWTEWKTWSCGGRTVWRFLDEVSGIGNTFLYDNNRVVQMDGNQWISMERLQPGIFVGLGGPICRLAVHPPLLAGIPISCVTNQAQSRTKNLKARNSPFWLSSFAKDLDQEQRSG